MPTPYYRQRDSGFAAVTHRSVWSPVRVHGGPCSRALPFAGRCEGPGPMSSPTPPMQGTLRPRLSHIPEPAPSSGWSGSLRAAVCGRSFARPSPWPLTSPRVPSQVRLKAGRRARAGASAPRRGRPRADWRLGRSRPHLPGRPRQLPERRLRVTAPPRHRALRHWHWHWHWHWHY
jgi:hypothetical protein